MRRRRKIALAVLATGIVAVASLAVALSHDSACGPAPARAALAAPMTAAVYRCYGAPEVVELAEIEKPVPADNQILVKVHAASINPLDWHMTRGKPYLMRLGAGIGAPTEPRLGVDYSGTVESVGKNVTRFQPGDAVFGGRNGALAEYIVGRDDGGVVPKPANLTFEQAAAVPVAAITALQSLRDAGGIAPGQHVLINGASGGVGTFAVQIAKAYGAHVTGVCSGRNAELVRSLGADRVIDYTQEDFTDGEPQYDLIVDNVANRAVSDIRRVLKPRGTYVLIGGGGVDADPWIGAFAGPIKTKLLAPFVEQKLVFMLANINAKDLTVLGELMATGKVTPVIDRSYPLTQVADALRYLEGGRARGKVVITMGATGARGHRDGDSAL